MGSAAGIPPHTGSFDFFGGTAQVFSFTELSQTVSIVGGAVTAALIDTGALTLTYSFWEQSVPLQLDLILSTMWRTYHRLFDAE